MSELLKSGAVVRMRLESEVLKTNPAGDPSVRDLFVYLPPGFDDSRRYASVYVLSGFTGRGKMMLNDSAFTPNFAERMDRLIGSGRIRPMIAVLPDCFTRYGGSQYLNSTATGDYEDYLSSEVVAFVDEHFPTVRDREARAVMGKSSGGYGALVMASRHSDVFGLACSTAGDAYFEMSYLPDLPKAFRAIKGDPQALLSKFWTEDERKSKHDFDGLNAIGMSACYSPNGASFDLPFDLRTGELRNEIWEQWLEHDPVRFVGRYADALKSLRLLFIDAGTRDEFALDIGARVLSRKLTELGVPHLTEEFDDGHFNISYRQNRSLGSRSVSGRFEPRIHADYADSQAGIMRLENLEHADKPASASGRFRPQDRRNGQDPAFRGIRVHPRLNPARSQSFPVTRSTSRFIRPVSI